MFKLYCVSVLKGAKGLDMEITRIPTKVMFLFHGSWGDVKEYVQYVLGGILTVGSLRYDKRLQTAYHPLPKYFLFF